MGSFLGTFQALDLPFDVTVEGDATVDVGEILRDLRAPDGVTATSSYRFVFEGGGSEDGDLFENDQLIGNGRDRLLVDILFSRLTRAIAASEHLVGLRATTLRIGEATVVLTGAPRRGKSTLAAKLLLGGSAALVAEEMSMLDPATFEVLPYHRPLGLTERAFGTLGVEIPPESGEPCGCGGKVLVAPEHLSAASAPAGRPTVVALVDQTTDMLQRRSPAATLAELLQVRAVTQLAGPQHLDVLAQTLAGAQCVALGSSDLDQAADWVTQLAQSPPPEPVTTLVEPAGGRVDVFAGSEAVIVAGETSHHLNQSAAAVWLLRTDGLGPDEIAAELQVDRRQVDDALAELATAGFA